MASNCGNFDISGMTGYDLILENPAIRGGTMTGTVIAKDCLGVDIKAGDSISTCSDLTSVRTELHGEITLVRADLTTAIAGKQGQLIRLDGTILPAGVCVMTCDETKHEIAAAIADVCGLQDMEDCQGRPVCSGTAIATCRDLADATTGVLRNIRDCKGVLIVDGSSVATCADLADIAVNLVDCRGTAVQKGAAVALCSDLNAKQDKLTDDAGDELPTGTCVVTCAALDEVTNDRGDTFITINGRGVRYVRTNDTGQTPHDAIARAVFSTAVGYDATASSDASIAIGHNAQGAGVRGVAIGWSALAGIAGVTGTRGAVAIGDAASAPTSAGTAIGPLSEVSGVGATAIGLSARASGDGAVALGGAIASHSNSVALGAGTQTIAAVRVKNYTIAGVQYAFAGVGTDAQPAPASVVSIGTPSSTRQVVNVAPGQIAATSTDAINGSQLFAAVQAIEAGGAPNFPSSTSPAITENGELPTSVIGARTAIMGTPAGWYDVVVNGVTHKAPYY